MAAGEAADSPTDLRTYTYDAFISYSWADMEVGAKIERDLEKFPLPKELRKRLGRRHLNVFRDVNDITGNRLDPVLESNLRTSKALVVLCSPAARQSRYVGLEIARFAEVNGADGIVPVLIAGYPNGQPGVPSSEWSFPEALNEALAGDPLAVDLRQAWNVSRRRHQMGSGSPWVQLIAGILGIATDDLTQRIAKTERRRLQSIVSALLVVLLVVAGLGATAWTQRNSARTERDRAQMSARQAVASWLEYQAKEMLAQEAPGGDLRAINELLAAQYLSADSSEGAMLDAVVERENLAKLSDLGAPIEYFASSPDTSVVATVREGDAVVRLWNPDTGQAIREIATDRGPVTALAFSPDGGRLVTAGGQDLRVWDVDTGAATGEPVTGHTDTVNGVSFTTDGSMLASVGYDATLRIWNAEDGTANGVPVSAPCQWLNAVSFSPDGRLVAANCGSDAGVMMWDVTTRHAVGGPMLNDSAWVESTAFSPDGSVLAVGDHRGAVQLWDVHTGQRRGEATDGHTGPVATLRFDSTGNRLAIGSRDDTISVWDVGTRRLHERLVGHTDWVSGVGFSPDGQRVVSGSRDGTLRVWEPDAYPRVLTGHDSWVSSIAYSPDGLRVYTSGADGVRVWNASTGQPQGKLVDEIAYEMALSPDGRLLAIAGQDSTLTLRSARTGHPIGTALRGHTDQVLSVDFSGDGSRVATSSSDKTVRVWDAATAQQVGELADPEDGILAVALDPAGRRLATAGEDGAVRLWDVGTMTSIGSPLTGHDGAVLALAFSADGNTLASGGDDSTVRLWDTETGQVIGDPMARHQKRVNAIAFSPDGRRLLSGAGDGTAQLWDVDTQKPIGSPYQGYETAAFSVAFSPDGHVAATGGYGNDTTLRVWPADPTPSRLCDKLTRNLSPQQWTEWVTADPDMEYAELCPGLPVAER